METTIIRFNRPLLIRTEYDFYQTVYGFVIKGSLDKESIKNLDGYVGYLAGLHDWSNGGNLFSVTYNKSGLPFWSDRQGCIHIKPDSWMEGIFKKCRKKLNLSYDLLWLDMDEDYLKSCLNEDDLIVEETLYYDLERYMGKKDNHQNLREYLPL